MSGDRGFTYFAALLMITVVSVSLMVVQKQWSTIVKREQEKELFFRAVQIVSAIGSYYEKSPGGNKQYPSGFDVLLEDNRFPGTVRHLRKWYKDPVSEEGEWGVVYDGQGRMKGVFSRSLSEPLKKAGFSEEYKKFEDKKRYTDWKFVYEIKKEAS